MSVALPSTEFDQQVEELRADHDSDYGGWYCVHTDPWKCPAVGCGFVAGFMTAAHLIVVWPSIDDSSILAQARNARTAGRNPKIIEYKRAFGPCIAFDEWNRIGCPWHGVAQEAGGLKLSDGKAGRGRL